jgi:5'(3')-deoxyribonucleotidase
MGTRLRILCDCDGVLADFVGLVLDYVQKNTGLSYLHSAVDKWDCFACLGLSEHWPYFRTQVDELGLCRSMRPLPGASEFYAALRTLGDVRVCTTPMTVAWLSQRAAWLVEFGVPLSEQIQWCDKHELVPAYDVLIDDKAENCEAFTDAGGVAFCIATPYNEHASPRIARGTHAECLVWLRDLRGAA